MFSGNEQQKVTIIMRTKDTSCFLVPFFSFVILLALLAEKFPCISVKFLLTMSRRKVLITNTDDSQLCNISLNPTLYVITKQLNSNQPV